LRGRGTPKVAPVSAEGKTHREVRREERSSWSKAEQRLERCVIESGKRAHQAHSVQRVRGPVVSEVVYRVVYRARIVRRNCRSQRDLRERLLANCANGPRLGL